jgi:hypothetical protein
MLNPFSSCSLHQGNRLGEKLQARYSTDALHGNQRKRLLFRWKNGKSLVVGRGAESRIKTNQRQACCLSAAPLQCRSQLKGVRRSQRGHCKLSLRRGSKTDGGLNFHPSSRQHFQQLACLPFACRGKTPFSGLPRQGRDALGSHRPQTTISGSLASRDLTVGVSGSSTHKGTIAELPKISTAFVSLAQ